jgi:soluble lytic murein transglycosylase-like protein
LDALYDAEFNIKCGTYYLHWIDERMNGMEQIVASYNAGLDVVQSWLADARYSADGEILLIDNIPIEQTRNYVKNVMAYYHDYCERYPD